MTHNKGERSEKKTKPNLRSSAENGLADATSRKISIPAGVWQGLEAVRRSGLTNMLDRPVVAQIAEEFGFPETTYWIRSNPKKYAEGIFKGYEIEHDEAGS